RMTRDGADRFGALTRSHLPEEQGTFRYRLALIVEDVVVAMPSLNSEIRDAGVIEFGGGERPQELARVVQALAAAAAYNAPPPTAKAVNSQAEAIGEAKAVDLPALAKANRVSIVAAASGSTMILHDPKTIAALVRALRPGAAQPGGG